MPISLLSFTGAFPENLYLSATNLLLAKQLSPGTSRQRWES